MNDPAHSDPAAVALELERLRGTVEVGFARVDGSLALLVQRSDQSDRQLAEHETRLDTLERARWPLPSIAAVTAVTGVVLSVWQLTGN
ncbi:MULTISPECIES: hypothetical protein [Streptomyces]|uniref:DUF3618 domain-containing protein n=1 Tax=Streptomyces cyaneofuscatus TaxID=66883 RepID=A0ABZ1EZW2_9ACTN|nr:hypothetical protein [Streptomyces cyaneofuscatus]WSB09700.1 hypothetical protein OG849_21940 [Streptomyces cyaneofuscatus]WSD46766.1 hypothetical protein OG857_13465 [Streptomyces cyaneofuscatus]WTA90140.1 hypothetical protein OG323_14480 [Streptomyces cyaneofuscatus]